MRGRCVLAVLGAAALAACAPETGAVEPAATPSTAATSTTAETTSTTAAAPSTTSTVTTPPSATIETVTAADLPASWRPGCPVAPEQLRRITVTHVGFDGADHRGVLIVHADWADELVGVFATLHAAGFPIERMEPIDAYGGSDDASTAANNTSAFNCRAVTGGTGWSRHAFGRAIDINPVQNPYVTASGLVLPPGSESYAADRTPRPGVIVEGDAVVTAFDAIGWRWGGRWADPVDHQHFDTDR
jgi:hypothetical protein